MLPVEGKVSLQLSLIMSYWGKYYCHYHVLKVLKTAKSLQSFCGKSFRNVMHSPYKSKTVSQTTLLSIQKFFPNVFQQQTRRVCDKQTGQAKHNETQNNFFQSLYFCFIPQELKKKKKLFLVQTAWLFFTRFVDLHLPKKM